MGFVISAISPAVLVPSLMNLQDEGLGVDKGIPTLMIAATSFDVISAVTFFGIFSSLAFNDVGTSTENPYMAIIKSIYQIFTGIVVGILLGIILGYSLRKVDHNRNTKLLKLFLILFVEVIIIA